MTTDIFPTVLELAGVDPDRKRLLDGTSLVPLIEGPAGTRRKPIGFWNYPTLGISVPAKPRMEDLYASQRAGREPEDPLRLYPDAAKIREQLPLDRFPGHAAWLDSPWKLHRMEDPKSGTLSWELYNLDADPKEGEDLYAREPGRSSAMRAALEEWLRSVARSHNGEDY